jgi:hypothetical protein
MLRQQPLLNLGGVVQFSFQLAVFFIELRSKQSILTAQL